MNCVFAFCGGPAVRYNVFAFIIFCNIAVLIKLIDLDQGSRKLFSCKIRLLHLQLGSLTAV